MSCRECIASAHDEVAVNGMVWNRPTTDEIDKLETLGNTGWNWNNLEPVSIPIP